MAAGEYLNFLSIDKWTMIFNLVNTLILYLIIKKFLFKPINKMINDRKLEIKEEYDKADQAVEKANQLKSDYYEKLNNANNEINEIDLASGNFRGFSIA